jgi:hypothetical protein
MLYPFLRGKLYKTCVMHSLEQSQHILQNLQCAIILDAPQNNRMKYFDVPII